MELSETFFPPPAGGEVSVEERAMAATAFQSLVDDAMLNHISAVDGYDTLGGYRQNHLALGGVNYSGHSSLPVYVEIIRREYPMDVEMSGDESVATILVERGGDAVEEAYGTLADPNGGDTHISIFKLFSDGSMTRTEMPWGFEKQQEIRTMAKAAANMPPENIDQFIDDTAARTAASRTFEREVGFNHTVVSPAEVGALEDLFHTTVMGPYNRPNPHLFTPSGE